MGDSNDRPKLKINRNQEVTQINILSQNTAKKFFFSYKAETAQKSTKDYVRKINLFLQNKPNSQNAQNKRKLLFKKGLRKCTP